MKHDQSNWINEKDKYYMLNNLISIIKYRFFSFEIDTNILMKYTFEIFNIKLFWLKLKLNMDWNLD